MHVFWITVAFSAIASTAGSVLTEWLVTERIAVLGSFVGLQKSYNAGIAFGIRLPAYLQELLIGSALVGITYMALRTAHTRLSAIGFGLIIGGGAANIIDRIPDGLVTDVLQVGSFPIFNLADSCITVGVGLLLLEGVMMRRRRLQVDIHD